MISKSKAIQGVYDEKLAKLFKKEHPSNLFYYEEGPVFVAAHKFFFVRIMPKSHFVTYDFLMSLKLTSHSGVGKCFNSMESLGKALYLTNWRYHEPIGPPEKGIVEILQHFETRDKDRRMNFLVQQRFLQCFDLSSQSGLCPVVGKVLTAGGWAHVIVLIMDTAPIAALAPLAVNAIGDKGTTPPLMV